MGVFDVEHRERGPSGKWEVPFGTCENHPTRYGPQARQPGRVPARSEADRTPAVNLRYGIDPWQFAVHSEQVNRPTTVIIDPEGIVRLAHFGTYWGDRPSIGQILKMLETGNYEFEPPPPRRGPHCSASSASRRGRCVVRVATVRLKTFESVRSTSLHAHRQQLTVSTLQEVDDPLERIESEGFTDGPP